LQNLKEITPSTHTGGCEYLLPYLPGNSARKLVNGAVMMVPENLLAFVDEVKMTGQLETPREGLMNIAVSFPSVIKPRLSIE
jgi:hypothetical protein